MIGIVNYGAGNIQSVKNALSYLGAKFELFDDYKEISKFDKIILPGVGAFGQAMENLKKMRLDSALVEFAKSGKPMLGICLGMQLFFEKSYEFGLNLGLGILQGEIVKFDCKEKIPHMGWNECHFVRQTPINQGLGEKEFFYFVHSYHAVCDESLILAKTTYEKTFPSAVCYKNIFGFQPHPEKSHDVGLLVLKNFMEICDVDNSCD